MLLSQNIFDFSVLSEIERDASERYREIGYDPTLWPTKSPAEFELFQNCGRLWVAYENNVAVGFAVADLYADSLHLEEVDVLRSMQGKGVGKSLVSAIIEYAKKRGVPRVTLRTFVEATWSCKLYERCGFQRTSLDYEALSNVTANEIQMGLDPSKRCSYVLELSSQDGTAEIIAAR